MISPTIREATAADVPALARLHVAAFDETHGPGPSFEVRERRWREIFQSPAGGWFCFVVEDQGKELIGFAKGQPYAHPDQPAFAGQLNKLYLLRRFHRGGLGRRLLGHVARRFIRDGIHSMLLFGDARSPSNTFYERLGADKLFAPNGEFHGGYGWRELGKLVALCPPN